MGTEADQPQDRQRAEAERRAPRHPQALPHARGCEHEERQHQPGRDLDPDAHDQRASSGAKARARPGGQRQRGGEQEHQQGVIVRAAHRQLQHDRVQSDECSSPARRGAQPARRPRDHRNGAEAGEYCDRFEGPQPPGEPERRRRVAREREQRPVWRILEGPSDERKDRVGRRFGSDVRVRVQAVQRPHASEVQVAEHILGDQRWAQEQDHVRRHDRRDDRSQGERPRCQQDRHVARAHDQRQGLEAGARNAHAEAFQGPGQPARPAACVRRNVLRGSARATSGEQQDGRHDANQAKRAQRTRSARAISNTPMRVDRVGRVCIDSDARHRGCGLHRLIVASTPPASMSCAR